jgi:hypothetical protein
MAAVVSRSYNPDASHCTRALRLLLKESVKEGGPPTAPQNDVKESNGYVATKNHSKRVEPARRDS